MGRKCCSALLMIAVVFMTCISEIKCKLPKRSTHYTREPTGTGFISRPNMTLLSRLSHVDRDIMNLKKRDINEECQSFLVIDSDYVFSALHMLYPCGLIQESEECLTMNPDHCTTPATFKRWSKTILTKFGYITAMSRYDGTSYNGCDYERSEPFILKTGIRSGKPFFQIMSFLNNERFQVSNCYSEGEDRLAVLICLIDDTRFATNFFVRMPMDDSTVIMDGVPIRAVLIGKLNFDEDTPMQFIVSSEGSLMTSFDVGEEAYVFIDGSKYAYLEEQDIIINAHDIADCHERRKRFLVTAGMSATAIGMAATNKRHIKALRYEMMQKASVEDVQEAVDLSRQLAEISIQDKINKQNAIRTMSNAYLVSKNFMQDVRARLNEMREERVWMVVQMNQRRMTEIGFEVSKNQLKILELENFNQDTKIKNNLLSGRASDRLAVRRFETTGARFEDFEVKVNDVHQLVNTQSEYLKAYISTQLSQSEARMLASVYNSTVLNDTISEVLSSNHTQKRELELLWEEAVRTDEEIIALVSDVIQVKDNITLINQELAQLNISANTRIEILEIAFSEYNSTSNEAYLRELNSTHSVLETQERRIRVIEGQVDGTVNVMNPAYLGILGGSAFHEYHMTYKESSSRRITQEKPLKSGDMCTADVTYRYQGQEVIVVSSLGFRTGSLKKVECSLIKHEVCVFSEKTTECYSVKDQGWEMTSRFNSDENFNTQTNPVMEMQSAMQRDLVERQTGEAASLYVDQKKDTDKKMNETQAKLDSLFNQVQSSFSYTSIRVNKDACAIASAFFAALACLACVISSCVLCFFVGERMNKEEETDLARRVNFEASVTAIVMIIGFAPCFQRMYYHFWIWNIIKYHDGQPDLFYCYNTSDYCC